MSLEAVEELILPLCVAFVLLNFADVFTTAIALTGARRFVELNPIAAGLFSHGFGGYISAYLLKLVLAPPLLYMVFVKDTKEYHYEVRLLRLAALAVLVFADTYLGCIVLGNNVPRLLGLVL